jgi:hypothetical protein
MKGRQHIGRKVSRQAVCFQKFYILKKYSKHIAVDEQTRPFLQWWHSQADVVWQGCSFKKQIFHY